MSREGRVKKSSPPLMRLQHDVNNVDLDSPPTLLMSVIQLRVLGSLVDRFAAA